jgi:adenine deaminase
MMFCSDDKHPDSLVLGHINTFAPEPWRWVDVFKVLQVACLNPMEHYKLPIGRLRTGDPADLIVVDDLVDFRVRTYMVGRLVAENGVSHIERVPSSTPNNFNCTQNTGGLPGACYRGRPARDRTLRRAVDHG